MRGMSADQLLLVADEVCAHNHVSVRDYAALAAAAATTTASINGVPVHRSVRAAKRSLGQAIVALRPLTGANEVFAQVAGEILERINN